MAAGDRPCRRHGHRAADPRPRLFVRDRGADGRQLREAERVEGEVRQHDQRDQAEHEQRFAIRFEPARPVHEAPPEAEAHRGEHGKLNEVLPRRVARAERARNRRLRPVADHDQVQLAHQQRHESHEDHRVHQPGPEVAGQQAGLPDPHLQQPHRPLAEPIEAVVRRERGDDRELAPGHHAERGEAGGHQQRNEDGTHRALGRGEGDARLSDRPCARV